MTAANRRANDTDPLGAPSRRVTGGAGVIVEAVAGPVEAKYVRLQSG